jgi:hypothetical protein
VVLNQSGQSTRAVPVVAFAAAVVLALGIGHDLLHMPLQVSDSLAPLLDAVRSPSAGPEFRQHLSEASYFRPMRFATIKVVSDLANGQYFLVYRVFHALLVLAFLILFVRALQIRPLTLAVAPLALTVLAFIRFWGRSRNLSTNISSGSRAALLALNLAHPGRRPRRRRADGHVALAALIESGLLVGRDRRRMAIRHARRIETCRDRATLWWRICGAVRDPTAGIITIEERSTGYLLEALDLRIRKRFE